MSIGSGAKKQAQRSAELAQQQTLLAQQQTAQTEAKLRKERERQQRLFIRQVRARQAGGFLSDSAGTSRDTIG